jgi:SPP1 family predicted phage head-tail adaptor
MAKAGQMSERVVIQRLQGSTPDAYGNVSTGWATVATRWADIRERTGKEQIEGGALAGVSSATIRMRSDSTTQAITEADKLVARGHDWDIESIIQLDRANSMIEILAKRGVAA